jgi:hypothetical protein
VSCAPKTDNIKSRTTIKLKTKKLAGSAWQRNRNYANFERKMLISTMHYSLIVQKFRKFQNVPKFVVIKLNFKPIRLKVRKCEQVAQAGESVDAVTFNAIRLFQNPLV